jgi:1-acyl-sn-glycerol-3-phosphate acyltransferase
VRRPVALLLLAAVLVLVLALLPLLVTVAALLSVVLPGRWRVLRLLGFLLAYLLVELGGLIALLLLWLASGFGLRSGSPAFQRAHYAVLRGVLRDVVAVARRLFHLELDTDGVSWSPLDDGTPGSTNAMVVLARHAGPGDSLLLVETLMDRDHLRRPRIVLKDQLQWDPLLDVLLNRLPAVFVAPGRPDLTERIGELASGLGQEDALLIFPEGANFSEGRRRRAIDRLLGKGMVSQARRAEQMRHVLPPRSGGMTAALQAAPHADVVLVAHAGLEHLSTVADLWDGLPMDSAVRLCWWYVPGDQVPDDPAAQEDWLYEHWAEVDRWVASHLEPEGRQAGRPRTRSPSGPGPDTP